MINLSEVFQDNCGYKAKFVKIKAGYSHALILDSEGCIYTYGANSYG